MFNSSVSKFICMKLFSYFITSTSRHAPHDCVTKACKDPEGAGGEGGGRGDRDGEHV